MDIPALVTLLLFGTHVDWKGLFKVNWGGRKSVVDSELMWMSLLS